MVHSSTGSTNICRASTVCQALYPTFIPEASNPLPRWGLHSSGESRDSGQGMAGFGDLLLVGDAEPPPAGRAVILRSGPRPPRARGPGTARGPGCYAGSGAARGPGASWRDPRPARRRQRLRPGTDRGSSSPSSRGG